MIIDRTQLVAALPQYDVGEPLGRGAHGFVFTARHRRLGSSHAVKTVMIAETDAPSASRRFLTEARVMTALDHPHIVRVNEYAEHGSTLLLVMEHLGGGTLNARMGGPVAPEVASAWMLAVAEALAVAHRQGVVHRDIKPANLLFTTDGVLKVGDFGIAKLFAGSDASASADIVGTPRYIAPEQIAGGRIGPPTDLYALGMTFYELLAGHPPFPPDLNMPGLLHHHLSVAPRPLDGVPPSLAALVLGLLAKDPADRPQSAREFAEALVAAADRDLGHDWIARSGVPLRIDGALLHREPSAPRWTPPAAAGGPPGAPAAGGPPGAPAAFGAQGAPGAQGGQGAPGAQGVHGPDGAAGGQGGHSGHSGHGAHGAPSGHGGPGGSAGRSDGGDSDSLRSWNAPRGRRRPALIVALAALGVLVVTAVAVLVSHRLNSGDPAVATSKPPSASAPAAPAAAAPGTQRATDVLTFRTGDVAGHLAVNAAATEVAYIQVAGQTYVRSTKPDAKPVGPLGGADSLFYDVAFVANPDQPLYGDTDPLLTGGSFGDLEQWDPKTGREAEASETASRGSGEVFAVAFSGDGATMAGADDDGELWVYSSVTGIPDGGSMRAPENSTPSAVAISPNGNLVATAGDFGVQIWDVRAHTLAKSIPNWKGRELVTDVAFSADGTRLAAGSVAHGVRLYDPTTGKRLGATIDPGSDGDALALGFDADSTALVTYAANTVRWWGIDDAKQLGRTLDLHTAAAVKSVAFNSRCTALALGLTDGTVHLWKLA
ncbi:WD40 repeat domain-containing serine/threonine protein kinase [Cryptosporangium phraense]|uniref:non-specific serine/threonine protein kinase n=1 Tax=Cryptosporangium phraense TaxID=2593070 RepID=A0A545AXK5_9ACTN|nr:serine/threonine-protein kinase [Cryptosporangium phraense]TQS46062.1 protein kinase [Cryptosporangium phraense]